MWTVGPIVSSKVQPDQTTLYDILILEDVSHEQRDIFLDIPRNGTDQDALIQAQEYVDELNQEENPPPSPQTTVLIQQVLAINSNIATIQNELTVQTDKLNKFLNALVIELQKANPKP